MKLPELCLRCADCGVEAIAPHEPCCDVARCLANGRQRLSCPSYGLDDDGHSCGLDLWTGMWPGALESWIYQVDINALTRPGGAFRWDAGARLWVAR